MDPFGASGGGLPPTAAAAPAPYTFPGVLDFLTQEWRKFSRERAQWQAERAQWEARVALLEGEKRAAENLKNDLRRRVLMLQYALRQERLRSASGKPKKPSKSKTDTMKRPTAKQLQELGMTGAADGDIGSSDTIRRPRYAGAGNEKSRTILRGYLEEMDMAGTWIKMPMTRTSVTETLRAGVRDTAPAPAPAPAPASPTPALASVSAHTVDEVDDSSPPMPAKWAEPRKHAAEETTRDAREEEKPASTGKKPKKGTLKAQMDAYKSSPSGAGAAASAGKGEAREDAPEGTEGEEPGVRTWKQKCTLRSHFDGVRALSFHKTEAVLLSASEDCTLKLWNLRNIAGGGKKGASPDIEPVFTFRGHTGPVFACILDDEHKACFSGGSDSIIRLWSLPAANADPYDSYGSASSHTLGTYAGHTDCVWDLRKHPIQNLILSSSSDGTVRLWNGWRDGQADGAASGAATALRQVFSFGNEVPTSCDFIESDQGKCIATYQSSTLVVYDLETGQQVVTMRDDTMAPGVDVTTQANRVITHPTMPWAITCHEDKRIRFFDISKGKLINSMAAHSQAVGAIALDPSGLYLMSGGHDSTIRLWDVMSYKCIQHLQMHRPKHEESIHAVAFHPEKVFAASAGADSTIKIYQ